MNRTFITSSTQRTLLTYARLLLGNLFVAIGFAVFILNVLFYHEMRFFSTFFRFFIGVRWSKWRKTVL
jgi:hypothetical protein